MVAEKDSWVLVLVGVVAVGLLLLALVVAGRPSDRARLEHLLEHGCRLVRVREECCRPRAVMLSGGQAVVTDMLAADGRGKRVLAVVQTSGLRAGVYACRGAVDRVVAVLVSLCRCHGARCRLYPLYQRPPLRYLHCHQRYVPSASAAHRAGRLAQASSS